MSLYQFAACADAFNRANEDVLQAPTSEEFMIAKEFFGDVVTVH